MANVNSGFYSRSFLWKLADPMFQPQGGQRVPNFSENGIVWGQIEENTSDEGTFAGGRQGQVSAIITLRQWFGIKTTDRLIDRQFGDEWDIVGCRRGNYEMILDVVRYEGDPLEDQ